MRRGTTPTLTLELDGVDDLTVFDKIIITFKQGSTQIDKEPEITDDGKLSVRFTQQETLKLTAGKDTLVQAKMSKQYQNYVNVVGSDILRIDISEILNEVIM